MPIKQTVSERPKKKTAKTSVKWRVRGVTHLLTTVWGSGKKACGQLRFWVQTSLTTESMGE
jgi:hypothetical protein